MMYFDNYGKEYDSLVTEFGEEKAFSRYRKQKGKFVVVNAREDNTTRLFIQSLYDIENIDRKDGWWNTFTICDEPQKVGMYIAKIIDVRKDKDGYPNFIALPVIPLDIIDICNDNSVWTTMKRRNALWGFFKETNLFTEHMCGALNGIGFNIPAIYRKLNISENKYTHTDMYKLAMTDVFCGNITLKEIVNLLCSPTDDQIAHAKHIAKLQDFVINRNSHETEYPYLVKKLNRMIELDTEWRIKHDIEHIMYDFADIKYDQAVCAGHIESINGDDFDRAETYLRFDAERKAQKKAAKIAAKKASKKAIKDS